MTLLAYVDIGFCRVLALGLAGSRDFVNPRIPAMFKFIVHYLSSHLSWEYIFLYMWLHLTFSVRLLAVCGLVCLLVHEPRIFSSLFFTSCTVQYRLGRLKEFCTVGPQRNILLEWYAVLSRNEHVRDGCLLT